MIRNKLFDAKIKSKIRIIKCTSAGGERFIGQEGYIEDINKKSNWPYSVKFTKKPGRKKVYIAERYTYLFKREEFVVL